MLEARMAAFVRKLVEVTRKAGAIQCLILRGCRYLTFNGQMGEEATNLPSPHLARVPVMVKTQKTPYPTGVLLPRMQAVMPDSLHMAQHIEQAGRGSPI